MITGPIPDREIAQTWCCADLPEGCESLLKVALAAVYDGRGVQLSMRHDGVPAAFEDRTSDGWRDYYWGRLADQLRRAKLAPVRRWAAA